MNWGNSDRNEKKGRYLTGFFFYYFKGASFNSVYTKRSFMQCNNYLKFKRAKSQTCQGIFLFFLFKVKKLAYSHIKH